MRTPDEIVSLYEQRRADQAPRLRMADEVLKAYLGELKVALPELDEMEESFVGNLLNQGVDAMGQRISASLPDLVFYPTRPNIKASQKAARDKRAAVLGWWDANEMTSQMARRARWYTGHGMTGVIIRPHKDEYPKWTPRSPLETFPADCADLDDVQPDDVIFGYYRTLAWLKARYPAAAVQLTADSDTSRTRYEVIEYVDGDSTVLLARGLPRPNGAGRAGPLLLEPPIRHDYGCTPAIVLSRVGLGRPQGQFDQMVPTQKMQARLMALEVIAVQRGIFPDTWLESREREIAKIITHADGVRGEIGQVEGGTLRQILDQTSYMAPNTIDRLAESQRQTARIPTDFGGQSQRNVRTGARGDSIMAATVDGPVAEAQMAFARSLRAENRVAIKVQKYHYGNRKLSFYVSWKGAKGHYEYVPNDLFDVDHHTVAYSQAGSDVNGLVIAIGQRVGMGTMSKRTGMAMDPFIEDAEHEHDQIMVEGLEMALLTGLQQGASDGTLPPADLARIIQLVGTDREELAEAVMRAQEEAQKRQAAQVPAMDPAAQPGLAMPGMGAEQATIPEAPQGSQNLSGLLQSLRMPQRRVASEQPAVA